MSDHQLPCLIVIFWLSGPVLDQLFPCPFTQFPCHVISSSFMIISFCVLSQFPCLIVITISNADRVSVHHYQFTCMIISSWVWPSIPRPDHQLLGLIISSGAWLLVPGSDHQFWCLNNWVWSSVPQFWFLGLIISSDVWPEAPGSDHQFPPYIIISSPIDHCLRV